MPIYDIKKSFFFEKNVVNPQIKVILYIAYIYYIQEILL